MSENNLNKDRTEHAASLTGSTKISPAAPAAAAVIPIAHGLRRPVLTASND